MKDAKTNLMRKIIKYNVDRAYFGQFTSSGLDAAYAKFPQSRYWDRPVTREPVVVGNIDDAVICRALWHEMSYNPIRFGITSPFTPNGVESIRDFFSAPLSQNVPAFEVLDEVRYHLKKFVEFNCNNTQIQTRHGFVYISYLYGHGDENYQMLSHLRKAIHAVTTQNLKDFGTKRYGDVMKEIIKARHPNGFRGNKANFFQEKTSEDISREVADIINPVLQKSVKKEEPVELLLFSPEDFKENKPDILETAQKSLKDYLDAKSRLKRNTTSRQKTK